MNKALPDRLSRSDKADPLLSQPAPLTRWTAEEVVAYWGESSLLKDVGIDLIGLRTGDQVPQRDRVDRVVQEVHASIDHDAVAAGRMKGERLVVAADVVRRPRGVAGAGAADRVGVLIDHLAKVDACGRIDGRIGGPEMPLPPASGSAQRHTPRTT